MAVVLDAEKTTLDLYAEAWAAREPLAVQRLFGPTRTPQPALIMDVGANVGEWAAEARKRFPVTPIMCFEPQLGAYQQILKGIDEDENLHVIRLGLSDHAREATLMAESHQASVLATLHDRPDRYDYHGAGVALDREERVLLTTLDCFIDEECIGVPDFVKIDVEGHEYAVLLGARGCLTGADERSAIGVIQIEWNDCAHHAGVSWGHFLDLLGGRYAVYAEGTDGLRRVSNFAGEDGTTETRNYLFVHKSIDWFPRAGRA